MKIENMVLPDGCQAAIIEQTQFMPTGHMREVITAVCGNRGPVQSIYEPTAHGVALNSPEYDEAGDAAREDMSTLIGAMCLRCPNRQESPAGVTADEQK